MAVTREELEAVLRSQSEACASGDIDRVSPFVSSRGLGSLRNMAATMQMDVADLLRESSGQSEALFEEMAEFKNVETPEIGDTAGWFGSRIEGAAEDPDEQEVEFILIRFAREEGAWKHDGVLMHGMPKGEIESPTYAALEHAIDPEMRVDGTVHEAEEPVGEVEAAGLINLRATGYRIEVVVNGRETLNAEGGQAMRQVTSLQSGENVLKISAEPLGETVWWPEVEVGIYLPEEDYPKMVFSWKGDEGQAASTEQRFEI